MKTKTALGSLQDDGDLAPRAAVAISGAPAAPGQRTCAALYVPPTTVVLILPKRSICAALLAKELVSWSKRDELSKSVKGNGLPVPKEGPKSFPG
jgi:hypothetical protein